MHTCNRGRTGRYPRRRRRHKESERGIVLVAALVLAILYFALMQLMLVDSSRALTEAQRFRARIVASTLAENAVELAAASMLTNPKMAPQTYSDDFGTMRGTLERQEKTYRITAEGRGTGVVEQSMVVKIQGRIDGENITIDYADHSQ